MLGNEKYYYYELHEKLNSLNSDIIIAILDSCYSGAFARLKGGTRKPPFLFDTSNQIKGHAILTSSSKDEAAQESDSLGSSFFTHYLVSGLRGAADISKDKLVTLNEAYRYAFDETLNRTKGTQAGAQHPSYNIKLHGSGDLVITDFRSVSASLIIAENIQGKIFITDTFGKLIMEINKTAGHESQIAIPPGSYEITLDQDDLIFNSKIFLSSDEEKKLTIELFTPTSREKTILRGGKKQENSPEPQAELIHKYVAEAWSTSHFDLYIDKINQLKLRADEDDLYIHKTCEQGITKIQKFKISFEKQNNKLLDDILKSKNNDIKSSLPTLDKILEDIRMTESEFDLLAERIYAAKNYLQYSKDLNYNLLARKKAKNIRIGMTATGITFSSLALTCTGVSIFSQVMINTIETDINVLGWKYNNASSGDAEKYYEQMQTKYNDAQNYNILKFAMIGAGSGLLRLGIIMFACQPFDIYYRNRIDGLNNKLEKLRVNLIVNPDMIGGKVSVKF